MTTYNLKGQMVGNGVTNWDVDVFASSPTTFYQFQMIPDNIYQNYTSNYCFSPFNDNRPWNGTNIDQCKDLWTQMSNLITPLNWYDLYRKQYPESKLMTEEERYETVLIGGEEKKYKKGYTMQERSRFKFENLWDFSKAPSAVLNDALTSIVNSPDMRKALNIPDEIQAWE